MQEGDKSATDFDRIVQILTGSSALWFGDTGAPNNVEWRLYSILTRTVFGFPIGTRSNTIPQPILGMVTFDV
jgi:hypothetical protein